MKFSMLLGSAVDNAVEMAVESAVEIIFEGMHADDIVFGSPLLRISLEFL